MQSYLKSKLLTVDQKKLVFKARTRILEFGENFKAGEEHIMCPLCHLHFDNQDLVTECPEIRKKIISESRISDLYKETVNVKTVTMLEEIMTARKKYFNRC